MTAPSGFRSLRYVLWGGVLIAAFAAGALWLGEIQQRANNPSGTASGPIAHSTPFALTTHTGNLFDSTTLEGQPYLIFFGFTHCPDICPTTLLEVSKTLDALGPDADRLQAIFVTIDPKRDTVELLKAYLSSFDSRIVGLTGPENDIKRVARQYRIFYEKVPSEDGDYTMNHSASAFLYNGSGRLVSTLSFEESPDIREAKIRKLIAQ